MQYAEIVQQDAHRQREGTDGDEGGEGEGEGARPSTEPTEEQAEQQHYTDSDTV